ncbi:MAG: endolytic transglycosylase MltG [Desulfobulbaceae bacterium]|nr:MAG: endolytic transglycosylase MltG [Desulfobulbaceae bacterium]
MKPYDLEPEQQLRDERKPGGCLVRLVVLLLGLMILLVGAGSLWLWSYAVSPGPNERETLVFVPPGSSFVAIEGHLIEAGVLRRDHRFGWLAIISGRQAQLRAGEYMVAAGVSPWEILQLLIAGSGFRRQVTIPEGHNLYQVAELLADQQLLDAAAFIAFAGDPTTPARFAVPGPTLEGWLFPETYFFTRGQSKEQIVEVMVARTRRVLSELLLELGNDTGLNELEIMTMASIVEKEAVLDAERSLIAGVFFNRLERGMRLQADPTVIYGLKSFGRRLTRTDLRTKTPYNTYVIHGLPPGPIANPGRPAIAAVLRPEKTAYLFFVSRNNGSHQFSTNYRDHHRAVQRYQR